MKKIVFDLDYPIRALSKYIENKNKVIITDYNQLYNGKTFVEKCEEDNFKALKKSSISEFFVPYIAAHLHEIWTFQPLKWIEPTQQWITEKIEPYLGYYPVVRFVTIDEKIRMLDKYKDYILIEDNPFLPEHDRIILINTLYNENVKAKHRVYTPKELFKKISELV